MQVGIDYLSIATYDAVREGHVALFSKVRHGIALADPACADPASQPWLRVCCDHVSRLGELSVCLTAICVLKANTGPSICLPTVCILTHYATIPCVAEAPYCDTVPPVCIECQPNTILVVVLIYPHLSAAA